MDLENLVPGTCYRVKQPRPFCTTASETRNFPAGSALVFLLEIINHEGDGLWWFLTECGDFVYEGIFHVSHRGLVKSREICFEHLEEFK